MSQAGLNAMDMVYYGSQPLSTVDFLVGLIDLGGLCHSQRNHSTRGEQKIRALSLYLF